MPTLVLLLFWSHTRVCSCMCVLVCPASACCCFVGRTSSPPTPHGFVVVNNGFTPSRRSTPNRRGLYYTACIILMHTTYITLPLKNATLEAYYTAVVRGSSRDKPKTLLLDHMVVVMSGRRRSRPGTPSLHTTSRWCSHAEGTWRWRRCVCCCPPHVYSMYMRCTEIDGPPVFFLLKATVRPIDPSEARLLLLCVR